MLNPLAHPHKGAHSINHAKVTNTWQVKTVREVRDKEDCHVRRFTERHTQYLKTIWNVGWTLPCLVCFVYELYENYEMFAIVRKKSMSLPIFHLLLIVPDKTEGNG